MKREKQKEKEKKLTKAYETLAITDSNKKLPDSGASIPSEESVEEAKDWVDYNGLS